MRRILYLFVAVVLTGSCVSTIDLDPDEMIPYVYCILQNGDVQSLELHYLSNGYGEGKGPIDNADAKLYEEGSEIGTFKSNGDGKYSLEYAPAPLKNYRLSIKIPGFEEITAETTIPGIYTGNGISLADWPVADGFIDRRGVYDEEGNIKGLYKGTSYSLCSTYPYEGAFWFSGMDWDNAANGWKVAEYIASDYLLWTIST